MPPSGFLTVLPDPISTAIHSWPLTSQDDLDLRMTSLNMSGSVRYKDMPNMKSSSYMLQKLCPKQYLTFDLVFWRWPWPWHVMTQHVQLNEVHIHVRLEVSTSTNSKDMAKYSSWQYLTFDLEGVTLTSTWGCSTLASLKVTHVYLIWRSYLSLFQNYGQCYIWWFDL